MNRYSKSPISILLLSLCAMAPALAQPWTRVGDGVLGPARSVQESWYEVTLTGDGRSESERGDCLLTEYDVEGRCTRRASLSEDRVQFANEFRYAGDRVTSWYTDTRSLPTQGSYLEYHVRNGGTLIDEFEVREGFRRLVSRQEFDRAGTRVGRTYYAQDGSVERRSATVTDELGRPTTTAEYLGTDREVFRSRRYYREGMEGLESYDTTGRMRGKHEVYYDSLGREVMRLEWHFLERAAVDMLKRFRTDYDEAGRVRRVQAQRYLGGDPRADESWARDHDTVYHYGDDGRLAITISGATTTHWDYDQHGNWIAIETRVLTTRGRLTIFGRRRVIGYWQGE